MQRREFVAGLVTAIAVASTFPNPPSAHTGPRVHVVHIRNFVFAPKAITVRPGDTIRWINDDIVPHTATADDASWDTGEIKPNGHAEIVVTDRMVSSYFCHFHPMMKGTLRLT